jgi:hypothetical protein
MLGYRQCFGSALTLCGSGSSFLGECGPGSSFENECGSLIPVYRYVKNKKFVKVTNKFLI